MTLFHIWLIGACLGAAIGLGIAYRDYEQAQQIWSRHIAMDFALVTVLCSLFLALLWPAFLLTALGAGLFYSLIRWVLFPLYGLLFDGIRALTRAVVEAGP